MQPTHARRFLLIGSLLLAAYIVGEARLASAAEPLDRSKAARLEGDANLWYDIRDLGVEGRGWSDTHSFYDRLPGKAEGVVRDPVWQLSRHSAGMCVRFETDAPSIAALWTLRSASLAMPHMPATGVSGLDLYAKDESGAWRWLAVGQPTDFPTNQRTLAAGLAGGRREYLLYLPLYNGVDSVQVGLPPDAAIYPIGGREGLKPIVFYGTSITQGGCASRPGMTHAAILGRWLDRPTINLGFSGNGKMEPEVARLLAELDPSVYVIDCLPNMSADEVGQRVEPLVEIVRQARPQTPIVLVEDRTYADALFLPKQHERNTTSRASLDAAWQRLTAAGVPGLHYVKGAGLLGDDGEATVNGSHPTDLGFVRMAEALRPVLEPLLKVEGGSP